MRTTLVAVFAVLFIAAALIGCSAKTTPGAVGTNAVATGDTAGLDKAFDLPPETAADPTADLPSSQDIAAAGQ